MSAVLLHMAFELKTVTL